jgi:hypothetical protein
MAQDPPRTWRDVITVHPAADLFPLLGEDELITVGNDIRANGLIIPIAIQVEKDGVILLDGRNRLDAMERAGLLVSIVKTSAGGWRLVATENGKEIGLNRRLDATITVVGTNPVEYIASANNHRRHLTPETNRELIARLLKERPERSDRAIAELVGKDHKTVAAIRRKEEDVGSIPHVEKRVDTKGRKQPASKPKVEQPASMQQACDEAAAMMTSALNSLNDRPASKPKVKALVESDDPATVTAPAEMGPDAKHDDYQSFLTEADPESVKLLQRLGVVLQQDRNWAANIKAAGPVKVREMVNALEVKLDQYSQAKADRADKAKADRAEARADKA